MPDDEELFEDDDSEEEASEEETEEGDDDAAEAAVRAAREAVEEDKPKKKKGSRRGLGRARGTIPKDSEKSREADLVWIDVLAKLAASGKGLGAPHVSIRVSRMEMGGDVVVGTINGEKVQGDESHSPADAFLNELTEIHLTGPNRGPQTYSVQFLLRGGQIYDRGRLKLASPEEIIARSRGLGRPPQQPPWAANGGGPQGYGYGQLQPQGPTGYGGPQGYGGQQPQQQPQEPKSRIDRVEDDMREIKGLLRDFLRGGHQPQPKPEQELMMKGLGQLQEVAKLLEPFGVRISAERLGVGAVIPPAAAAPAQLPESSFEKRIAQKIQARIEKELDEKINGILDPQSEKEEPEKPAQEEKPEADFEMVEVPGGVVWPGTNEPVRYARDIETGKLNLVYTGFGNPHAMEKYGGKIIDIFEQIANAIKRGAVGQQRRPLQEEMQGEVVERRGLGAGIGVGAGTPEANGHQVEEAPVAEGPPAAPVVPPMPPLARDDDFSA
jgi:hypothetical protein